MWEARLHLTAKSRGLVAYLLMHMGGGGRGTAKTQKRVQGGVRKKVEGQTSPKEQSQLHLVSLRGTEAQERIPVTGLGGPRGRICSRLGTHRGQWWFFSSGDPLH